MNIELLEDALNYLKIWYNPESIIEIKASYDTGDWYIFWIDNHGDKVLTWIEELIKESNEKFK